MNWNVKILSEVDKDLDNLDGSVKSRVLKSIKKVALERIKKYNL